MYIAAFPLSYLERFGKDSAPVSENLGVEFLFDPLNSEKTADIDDFDSGIDVPDFFEQHLILCLSGFISEKFPKLIFIPAHPFAQVNFAVAVILPGCQI